MTFQLDTSGVVYAVLRHDVHAHADMTWSDLTPFTQGYVEAMFTSLMETPKLAAWLAGMSAKKQGQPISNAPFVSDASIAPAWRAGWRGDVAIEPRFSDLAPETLAAILKDCEANSSTDSTKRSGALFWRNRQEGAVPDFPPLTLTLSDDGEVVFQSK